MRALNSRQKAELEINSAITGMDRHCIDIDDILMASCSFDTQSMNSAVTCIRTSSVGGHLSEHGQGD